MDMIVTGIIISMVGLQLIYLVHYHLMCYILVYGNMHYYDYLVSFELQNGAIIFVSGSIPFLSFLGQLTNIDIKFR
jgi:hypothetical protein